MAAESCDGEADLVDEQRGVIARVVIAGGPWLRDKSSSDRVPSLSRRASRALRLSDCLDLGDAHPESLVGPVVGEPGSIVERLNRPAVDDIGLVVADQVRWSITPRSAAR